MTYDKLRALARSWREHWTVDCIGSSDRESGATGIVYEECADQLDEVIGGDTSDARIYAICAEWLKCCSCADDGKPEQCQECTEAFREALVKAMGKLTPP